MTHTNGVLLILKEFIIQSTYHARTELGFQDPGTGWIPPSPLVQFKLYQGEVPPYNPGTRDWVESTQSETPQAPTQSVRRMINTAFMLSGRNKLICTKQTPDKCLSVSLHTCKCGAKH